MTDQPRAEQVLPPAPPPIALGEPIDQADVTALCPSCFLDQHDCCQHYRCGCSSCQPSAPTITRHANGTVAVAWSGEPRLVMVTPDVIDGWAQNINQHVQRAELLRRQVDGLVDERDAIADHAADVTIEAAGRGLEIEELTAEVERLRGDREATVQAIEDAVTALDIDSLTAYDVERISRVACSAFWLPEVQLLRSLLAEALDEAESLGTWSADGTERITLARIHREAGLP